MSHIDTDKLIEAHRAQMDALMNLEAARARMERRDRFAMAALQGQLAREAHGRDQSGCKSLAEYAVRMADTLIAALDASKP